MAGKYLNGKQMYDLKKSEERTNAIKKREGKENYHVDAIVCGCPCPVCGGWHEIDETRPLPTREECEELLNKHNKNKNKNA
jgi:predicted nucleic acid-binding Zn ribbon protein